MRSDDDFRPKPLLRAHLHTVATRLRETLKVSESEEFWHVPYYAVYGKEAEKGIFDWVLAERDDPHRQNRRHRPIVALRYVPNGRFKRLDELDRRGGPLVYEIGADDELSIIAETVRADYLARPRTDVAESLGTPLYQQRLADEFGPGGVVALQEVALSDIARLSDSFRSAVANRTDRLTRIAAVPGQKRFDIVVATPPPMCFALAAIEIDGSSHRHRYNESDAIKEAFCDLADLPLFRIGLGHGGGMTVAHNEIQDKYVRHYASWIASSVSTLTNGGLRLELFRQSIGDIAADANSEVKKDLLALLGGLTHLSDQLWDPMMGALFAEDYERSEAKEREVKDAWHLVRTEVEYRRSDEGDLYFEARPRWHGVRGAEETAEPLPETSTVGPFKLRVIANDDIKGVFLEEACRTIAQEQHEHFEAHARETLGIDPEEDPELALERVNLLLSMRPCRDDVGAVEALARGYLSLDLPDTWHRVPADVFEAFEHGKWIEKPLVDCIKHWQGMRERFVQRVQVLEHVLDDPRLAISATDRELVVGVVDEAGAAWESFDERAANVARVTDVRTHRRRSGLEFPSDAERSRRAKPETRNGAGHPSRPG